MSNVSRHEGPSDGVERDADLTDTVDHRAPAAQAGTPAGAAQTAGTEESDDPSKAVRRGMDSRKDANRRDPEVLVETGAGLMPRDAKATPGSGQIPIEGQETLTNRGIDRGHVIRGGVWGLASWSWRLLVIGLLVAGVLFLLRYLWTALLPIMLALIVCTVLWPVVAFLRRRGWPPAASAGLTVVVALLAFLGVLAAITPSVIDQAQTLADRATQGINQVQDFLARPPLNLDSERISDLTSQLGTVIQEQGNQIASGVFTGVAAVGSGLVTLVLVLILSFFFLKDGPNFLPWLRQISGRTAGRHLSEVFMRCWQTLGGFIRAQAAVSAVDAVFIGAALLIARVPLAIPLAILTFFGGFIPIVGAFTVGALAVLVALVSNGWVTALIILAWIIIVQQVEGNVLQPILQSRAMQLHAGVILLAVAIGTTLFGIIGAFLSVPVAAILVVVYRYISEQIDLRTGDLHMEDIRVATPEGQVTAMHAEAIGKRDVGTHPDAAEEVRIDTENLHGTHARAQAFGTAPIDEATTEKKGLLARLLRR